jgi:hypothetical protein
VFRSTLQGLNQSIVGLSPLSETAYDEDMTPMHTTMIGAWNGVEEVQQGFPSQQGGQRLIRFESPRSKVESSSESRSSAQ